jgi:hypothetical protein
MPLTRASAGVIKTEEIVNNRNLVINGAMQVAQRNTSVTGITTNGYYTADRWAITLTTAGTWTMNVESSVPTGTEFRKSANLVCTTADSSLDAGDAFTFEQRFEGQNLQGIKKGTVNAESLTVSFWVKSSSTGTYICEFYDVDNARQISKPYTISATNTWEKKTITVPPDTTGQFDNDNGDSLRLFFWLASGTERTTGTLNSSAWASNVQANRLVGQLNLANRVGNYLAITGIQLERGSSATPYEWMDYGRELALCQRYYFSPLKTNTGTQSVTYQITYLASAGSSGWTVFQVPFPVAMRVAPTLTHNISDSNNRSDGAPSGTQWAFYLQNQGYAAKQGASNADVFNAASTLNHCQVGAYYVSQSSRASGIILGFNLTFQFSA